MGKSRSGFPNPKTDFAFLGANLNTDHESIKSTLRVDSLDQIQIRIFEIHKLSVFGKGFEKSIFDKRLFEEKKMVRSRSMPYMYDIVTEPMLVAPH